MGISPMKPLSICISTYEMGGKGPAFLAFSFDKLVKQTFKDFEVVVSDQSRNDGIEKVCESYKGKLDIRYFKEAPEATPSDNTNNAMRRAEGKLIKILFLDDFLYADDSLEMIIKNFDLAKDRWLLTACVTSTDGEHFSQPFYPRYDDSTILFKNTISAPSVMTMRNEDIVLFDPKLIWWQDLDFYKRCFERYGQPKILNEPNVAIRVHSGQMGNSSKEKRREQEFEHILAKHHIPHARRLLLEYRAARYLKAFKEWFKAIVGPRSVIAIRSSKLHLKKACTLLYYRLRFYPLMIRAGTSDADVARQVFIAKQYDIEYGGMDPQTIIDGGANVGYASAFFARRFPHAQIFAIEPEKSNFSALQKNTAGNPRIHPIQAGIWSKKAHLKVIDQGIGEWAFMTKEVAPGEPYDIDAVTVDDLIRKTGRDRIDILKLDIEGAERELFSADCDSWLDKIDMLILELHDRMSPGSSEAFHKAVRRHPFDLETRDELVILKRRGHSRKNP